MIKYFRIVSIILIIILVPFTLLSSQTEENLKIIHLTENFYIYTTYKDLNGINFPSNGMYLVTDSGVVLFDTPWDSTQFQPLLDSIAIRHKSKVIMSISTHYHDDRTAGLDFLKHRGVKTFTSKLTWHLCAKHNEKQSEYYFRDDTVFRIGNYIFETFYPGEGHTKDNIVVWFGKYKILYGGCLVKSVENNSLGYIADANLNEWGPSIKRVMQEYPDPEYVIPGHFNWTNKLALQHTLKLLPDNLEHPVSRRQQENRQPLLNLCKYFENEQLDSCIRLFNGYIRQHPKRFTYQAMELTTDSLVEEFDKLHCNISYWKEGYYVDELNFKPLPLEEQRKRLNKSKPLILDGFILRIKESTTLIYKIRYSVSKKTEVVSIIRATEISW